jgi:hypothetical protein
MERIALEAAYEALRDRPTGRDVRMDGREASALYAFLRRPAVFALLAVELPDLERLPDDERES